MIKNSITHGTVFTTLGGLLVIACSSSSSTTSVDAGHHTDAHTTSDAGSKKDTGGGEDVGACIPLGGTCTENTELDCCVMINGPAIACSQRNNTGTYACRHATGETCTADGDCIYGSCTSGTCAAVPAGGTCGPDSESNNSSCVEKTDAGVFVVCAAGTCTPANALGDAGGGAGDGPSDAAGG
jgi:hypothetical protein